MKKLSKKKQGEIDGLVKKAIEWTNSQEGRDAIEKAFKQARKVSEEYTKACYIHPNDPRLFEPMTI